MRSLFLSTSTNETDKYRDCLTNLKLGETHVLRYDNPAMSDPILYGQVKDWAPDLIVYIGSRWGKQPSIACLSKMAEKLAPSVHICSDAADMPWHDLLREYHLCGAFTVQVAIDGSHKWPLASSQMTALTPVDPILFPQRISPHAERGISCGFAGNGGGGPGSKRTELLGYLLEKRILDLRIRSNLPYTYESYCDYLGKCRTSLNIAYSGTEQALQVKGRVLESGLAGACLLETAGAPTSYWFRPGLDYLEYKDPADLVAIITRIEHEPEATQAMAESLRRRVLSEHSPAQFWNRIFGRIGLKVEA